MNVELDVAQQRAERFGIEKPLCQNCQHGNHETDGDHGEIDCGWFCELQREETEPDHLCVLWVPDFWQTPFACEVGGDSPDEVAASMKAAQSKYHAAFKAAYSLGEH